jgi:hypothetical protein
VTHKFTGQIGRFQKGQLSLLGAGPYKESLQQDVQHPEAPI